jgi:hypothetical protein
MKPLRLLVFVRPELDCGPILAWDGPVDVREDLSMAGWDMGDHEMPCSLAPGLMIFEGWRECASGPEPSIYYSGEWRRLSFWELSRVRHGLLPWSAD